MCGSAGRGAGGEAPAHEPSLRVYQDEDGMVVVRGRLEPEVGALFLQALAAARESLYQRARERDRASTGFGNVSAEPVMWLSPLPMHMKLSTIVRGEGPEVGHVTGAERARRGT